MSNEIQLMATVAALSGGAMIFSDNLSRLDESRIKWAARLLPPMDGAPLVLDQFERARPQQLLLERNGYDRPAAAHVVACGFERTRRHRAGIFHRED